VEAGLIVQRPSPNHNARHVGFGPEIICLHGTAGFTDAGDLSWLCSPASKVSYHYLVGRDGTVFQLVKESRRAWHAGKSAYQGKADPGGSVNSFSLGIAFSNRGPLPSPEPYTDEQYESGAELCADIWERRGLDIARITTHAAVSPGRKTDPWVHFDMGRFLKLVVLKRVPPPDPTRLPLAA
jgi:N-acetylmuramoyl-L-alanine amidase